VYNTQQVSGPVAPGQYSPLQVSGPGAYYPSQTSGTDWGGMMSMMMPMIMMVMMMAIMMPMLRGVTAGARE
jgi:hypothetical protein